VTESTIKEQASEFYEFFDFLLEFINHENFNSPLTLEEFEDSNNISICVIAYLLSMEPSVMPSLNRAYTTLDQ